MVVTDSIMVNADEDCDVVNITNELAEVVKRAQMETGLVTVFCAGATGGLTTMEHETGVISDLERVLEKLAPVGGDYEHNARQGDDNGSAHLRAALVGPSITIPVVAGELTLGTYQRVAFINFDTRPRLRRLVVQMVGESSS